MRIAIGGGSGFIGQALTKYWSREGHEIIVLSRRITKITKQISSEKVKHITWEEALANSTVLEGLDGFVNLAGASLNQRWTSSAKNSILNSRVQTVKQASSLLAKLTTKPKVLIQSSAVGIYGISTEDTFDESSTICPSDFLSEVCVHWESEADAFTSLGIRTVKLRTGLVLGHSGGAFPLIKLPYMLGFGGRIGSGSQWMSWIHLHDLVRLIDHCIKHSTLNGPVNATAPKPVTNDEFGRTIGSVYRRPHWFPLPERLMRIVLGERATLLLDGQRVLPQQALQSGFQFQFADLKSALKDLRYSGALGSALD
ncbi:TIGR01777 family protein [Paenibacillus sp. CAA11]|uniref:TIGR01777 family oxidoreductase n=1 Tax=Paenibacillus sp. CAA11 TaxID=1532905 RepID=UPI000D3CD9CC|nr:TIGR01777 family oxidoreductase [Paenibacillus sp. CAA11]AWB43841.1 TIGR01777 family protein [Paenibacillus sp. CAA11]